MSVNPRRNFLKRLLTGSGLLSLSGCDALSKTEWFANWLSIGETLNNLSHHSLTSPASLAREYPENAISFDFRGNGSINPQTPEYLELVAKQFLNYRLKISGLVENPMSLSLNELRSHPSRTQVTRHDCVEGWSAIGKWKGVPLSSVLDEAKVTSSAKFVVFRCADTLDGVSRYYESIDLEDAFHPQTILAYELNDEPLPIKNGAPLRVRIERQLGYKMAKYIMEIQLVESFEKIEGGKGGTWEDEGYEWYAGI